MVDLNAINIADYRLVCRTCLALDGDFLNLNESCKVEASKNMSYLECLNYCMHVDNLADMPGRICSECSAALKVTYTFMYNAWRAQQILKNKWREIDQNKDSQLSDEEVDIKKPKRFRCKVCNVKVETKRSLKDHIKLHLDLISYNCQLCVYETGQRDLLNEHYQSEHGVEASKELLKPVAKTINDAKRKQQKQKAMTDEPLIQREVVIEYISAPNPEADLNDNLVLDNATTAATTTTTTTTIDNSSIMNEANGSSITTNTPAPDSDCVEMDVDDFIVEDAANNTDDDQNGFEIVHDLNAAIKSITTATPTSTQDGSMTLQELSTSLVCKICTKECQNQQQLKLHMLTHEEIPHFFCERCTFYTFFKIDLQQHYRNKHNMAANRVQLQPRNGFQPIEHFNDILLKCSFGCDMCLFECSTQVELKQHYNDKHKAEANDVQLRPHNLPPIPTSKHFTSAADVFSELKSEEICSPAPPAPPAQQNGTNVMTESPPDYPNGLRCKKCYETFFYREKLYEHYKKHSVEENAAKKAKLSKTKQQQQQPPPPNIVNMLLNNANAVTAIAPANELSVPRAAEIVTTTTTTLSNHISAIPPVAQLTSAAHTIPSDAIPQIVETDQTVVDHFVFDFNNDTIFEEFDDDVDLDAETANDNAEGGQHNHDSDAFYLTSDEETDEQQQVRVVSHCVQCQKNFMSQYQFENHMFIHRGLAPYRCEMCTNLYNTKKALIRHYKAVHKKVPTRDMIQAKGDKALNINQNELHMNDVVGSAGEDEIKVITLMCAKCPFETHDYDTLTLHLSTFHAISDENYIIQKLPYECPKCIRSFVSKSVLLKHIEHNHSNVLPTKQPCIRSPKAAPPPPPPPQQQQQQHVPFNLKNTITTNELNISANTINSTSTKTTTTTTPTMDNSISGLINSSTGCGKVYKVITAKSYDTQMTFAHNQHFHQHPEQ